MAAKNTKKLSYNLDALMEDFKSSLGLSLQEAKELENLTIECANLETKISDLRAEIETITIPPKENSFPRSVISGVDLNSEREAIIELISALKDIEELVDFAVELKTKDPKTFTFQEKSKLNELKSKRNFIFQEFRDIVDSIGVTEYFELIEKCQKRVEDIDKIKVLEKELNENEIELQTKSARKQVLEGKSNSSFESTAENFKLYLEDNGFSTEHAQELFDYYQNPSKNPLRLNAKNMRIRKIHPKRDAFIKKFAVPTAITAGAFGISASAITAAGLVDGSSILGLIPISQTPGLTVLATGCVAAAIGVIATPLIIVAKDKLTKLHYNLWYKGAKANLDAYENGTELESLYISKLIEKIKKTKHSILEKSQGNFLSRLFNFIPKHILNAVNRNRIHHLEAYTKELMELYALRENHVSLNTDLLKAQKLQPIVDLLKQVEDFIADDIAESKVYAMLTCKESGKHTHKSTIENIDIFANLKMYVDAIAQKSTTKEISKAQKTARAQTRNISQKISKAGEILNNEERLFTRMLNYNARYARFVEQKSSNEFIVVSSTTIDGNVTLILDNGNSISVLPNEVSNPSNISKVKLGRNKTTFFYQDGTSVDITKPKKVIPEIETTRRVMWDKLTNDAEFIQSMKDAGFKSSTIKNLTQRLEQFINNEIEKLGFTKTSAMGRLYTTALEAINAKTANYEAIIVEE